VFLGASWSHVDPISKINQNYCTLWRKSHSKWQRNIIHWILEVAARAENFELQRSSVNFTNRSPFPLTCVAFVGFVSNPITDRTVYPMTCKSRMIQGSNRMLFWKMEHRTHKW
jgi:hypothetical protein